MAGRRAPRRRSAGSLAARRGGPCGGSCGRRWRGGQTACQQPCSARDLELEVSLRPGCARDGAGVVVDCEYQALLSRYGARGLPRDSDNAVYAQALLRGACGTAQFAPRAARPGPSAPSTHVFPDRGGRGNSPPVASVVRLTPRTSRSTCRPPRSARVCRLVPVPLRRSQTSARSLRGMRTGRPAHAAAQRRRRARAAAARGGRGAV